MIVERFLNGFRTIVKRLSNDY